MSACHGADLVSGGASSSRRAEPHFETAQMGASRSNSPDRARIERRLLEARKLGAENWYLSGKRDAGRVRYVWRAQSWDGGSVKEGNVRRRVG